MEYMFKNKIYIRYNQSESLEVATLEFMQAVHPRSITFRDHNMPQQQQITILKEIGLDCELWERSLQKASQGVSMNQIPVCQLTRLSVPDSCAFGIGGFLLRSHTS